MTSSYRKPFRHTFRRRDRTTILWAIGLAIVCLFALGGRWYAISEYTSWAAVPVQSVMSWSVESRPNDRVLIDGVIATAPMPGEGYTAYIAEYERCRTDDDGDRHCSWYHDYDRLPPLDITIGSRTIHVTTGYRLTGNLETTYRWGRTWRARGVTQGARVTIAAIDAGDAPYKAVEVYAGSPKSYVAGWNFLSWGLLVIAVVAAFASGVCAYVYCSNR